VAKRILFSGSIAGHPVGYGGNTWAFLQWVFGFRRLGFDVYYANVSGATESTASIEATVVRKVSRTSTE
jgi:hypothetical protein